MRVTFWRDFRFEAAHYLSGYEGKCGHIHGHNYVLRVKITGVPDEDGFIIAADKLKELLRPLMNRLDHALIIDNSRTLTDDTNSDAETDPFWRNTVAIGKRPTTENLALWIHSQIMEIPFFANKMISHGWVIGLDLQETHAMGVSIP